MPTQPNPTNTQPPLLQATNLSKTYHIGKKSIPILHNINLTIQPTDFIAIHGASGAGKTTLLHLLSGLDTPDTGQIQYQQKPLHTHTPNHLARWRNQQIGYIFQAYHLLPELTALENITLPGRIARRPQNQLNTQAHNLLEHIQLTHRKNHRPYELSGGEQQRIAIARALINQPQLLLADEPTGNLDTTTSQTILNLLQQLQSQHTLALILATHDHTIGKQAQQTLHLTDGKLQPQNQPTNQTTQPPTTNQPN